MKLTSLLKAGLLTAAFSLPAVHSAKAVGSTPNYSDGDWLLGFYSGGTKDFVLDLNAALNETTINPHVSFTLLNTTSHLGDDLSLSAAFGSSWYSANSGVVYGVAESVNNANPITMYMTNPDLDQGTWPSNANELSPSSSDVSSIGVNSANQLQQTGQQSKGLIQADSSASSWFSFASPNGGSAYFDGYFANADNEGDGCISDIVTNKLQFDALNNNGTATKIIGTFSLDSAGDLTYTAAAVPEPSTFAAIGLGALLLASVRRRRRA